MPVCVRKVTESLGASLSSFAKQNATASEIAAGSLWACVYNVLDRYPVTSESGVHRDNFYFLSCALPQPPSSFRTAFLLSGRRITHLPTLTLSPSLCHSSSSNSYQDHFPETPPSSLPSPTKESTVVVKSEHPACYLKLHTAASRTTLLLCLSSLQVATVFLVRSRAFCLCCLHTVPGPPQLLLLERHLLEELSWHSLPSESLLWSHFFMPCPAALPAAGSNQHWSLAISVKFLWPGKLLSSLVGKSMFWSLDGLDSKS